MGGLEQF